VCRDSSVGIASRYGLDRPVIESRWGGEIFRTCPDRPCGPAILLYNGYRVSLLGLKHPRRASGHRTPSSAEVEEIVELYIYSPFWDFISWYRVKFLLLSESSVSHSVAFHAVSVDLSCTQLHTHCVSSVHCPLSNVHCPLSNFHSSLSTVHCPLSSVHCPLPNV
jgi:hypothetical protein